MGRQAQKQFEKWQDKGWLILGVHVSREPCTVRVFWPFAPSARKALFVWIDRVLVGQALFTWSFGLLTLGAMMGCLPIDLGTGGSTGTGGQSASDDKGEERPDYDVEPGSCDAWKVAYCEAVDECSAFESHADCAERVGYVRCAEEAPIQRCQKDIEKALDKKACKKLPDDCDPEEIADRTVPTRACRALYEAVCEWAYFCGLESSIESCSMGLSLATPCDQFTAVLPGLDECLDGYRKLACDERAPSACEGLLRR